MKAADWDALKEKIALPDIDKHLVPLLLYRGSKGIGRMSRLWNFTITCMESEVETFSEAVKLSQNPDFAHLVGPHKPIVTSTLPGLFGRLLDNPLVTDNIPGLTHYVRDIRGRKFGLARVSPYTNSMEHPERTAPWRVHGFSPERQAERNAIKARKAAVRSEREALKYAETALRRAEREEQRAEKRDELAALRLLTRAPREKLFYPYMAYRPGGSDEALLVQEVNAAVPKHLADWLRADICQDLIVAILAGEIQRDELQDSVRGFGAKVLKMHPLKYGPLSLDQIAGGEDTRSLGEKLGL